MRSLTPRNTRAPDIPPGGRRAAVAMNVVREVQKLNEEELRRGVPASASWHAEYARSAWVYVGGLAPELSEGDVICVLSQWGEVEDVHLVRDEATGRSKGFCFLKYEDARSAVLAVDNFNGVSLLGRTLRVDHKLDYSPPKAKEDKAKGAAAPAPIGPGHAYAGRELAGAHSIAAGVDVFAQQRASQQAQQRRSAAAAAAEEEDFAYVPTRGPQRAPPAPPSASASFASSASSAAPSAGAADWRGRYAPSAAAAAMGGAAGGAAGGGGGGDDAWRGRYAARAPAPSHQQQQGPGAPRAPHADAQGGFARQR